LGIRQFLFRAVDAVRQLDPIERFVAIVSDIEGSARSDAASS